MVLLLCPEKGMLTDFDARFLEFKDPSNRLYTFVIYAGTVNLFVYRHLLTLTCLTTKWVNHYTVHFPQKRSIHGKLFKKNRVLEGC